MKSKTSGIDYICMVHGLERKQRTSVRNRAYQTMNNQVAVKQSISQVPRGTGNKYDFQDGVQN